MIRKSKKEAVKKEVVFSPYFQPGEEVTISHLKLEAVVIYVAYNHRGIDKPTYLLEWVDNENRINSSWYDQEQLVPAENY